MNFEENMERLEQIVEELSDDKTGLDDGIALYEDGIRIAKESLVQLSAANGKIKILQAELNGLIEKDFAHEE